MLLEIRESGGLHLMYGYHLLILLSFTSSVVLKLHWIIRLCYSNIWSWFMDCTCARTHTRMHAHTHLNRKPLSTTQLNLSVVMEMISGWLVWSKLHPWTPGFFQMQKDLWKIIINREMLPWQQKLRQGSTKMYFLCAQAGQQCSYQNLKYSTFSI